MATNETSQGQEQARGGGATTGGEKAEQAKSTRPAHREAYWGYLRALQESAVEAQRRSTEAHQRYMRARQEHASAHQNALKRYEEAYRLYVEVMRSAHHEAGGEKEGGRLEKATEAYRGYTVASQEAMQAQWDAQRGQEEAYHEYATTLRQLWDSSSENSIPQLRRQAYHKFLRELQDVWVGLDVSAMSPDALAAFGQDLISAASYASASAKLAGQ